MPDLTEIFNDKYSFNLPTGYNQFKVLKASKAVSIGSCFSRNIDRWLRHNGYFNKRDDYPWEVFYNPFSICGEIYRLFSNEREPPPISWIEKKSNKLVYSDPWRSWLISDSKEQLSLMNEAVNKASYSYISEPSFFLLTLGLTEIWFILDRPDIICNQVPIYIDEVQSRFGFRFASVQEIVSSTTKAIRLIRSHFNREVPIVLSLSPVPLKYTSSGKSVHVANSLSKSILRVAIEEICNNICDVYYFHSFEIVNLLIWKQEKALQKDGRHVTALVVDIVAKNFIENFCIDFFSNSDEPFSVPSVEDDGSVVGRLYVDGSVTIHK